MRSIVVTGTDAEYFHLAQDLIDSIRSTWGGRHTDIGLLDGGLHDIGRHWLHSSGIKVVDPGWDYDFTEHQIIPPTYLKCLTARPHLPRHFPGYDVYVWLDADTWVQRWESVELAIEGARERGFSVTPELDRSYAEKYVAISVRDFRQQCYGQCLSKEMSDLLIEFPLINAGVFSGMYDAPHWKAWDNLVGTIYSNNKHKSNFFVDQTALNAIVRLEPLSTALLPATSNWMCNRALPMVSEDGIVLFEPHPPYEPIGIMHLTANTKNGIWPLKTRSGNIISRSLRYEGRAGKPVILPG